MVYRRVSTISDLEEAFRIRKDVFVAEQGVPPEGEFDAFDSLDSSCEHILVYYQGRAVGTGRMRIVNGTGKFERICILKPYRSFGLGKVIIQALETIARDKGIDLVKLHGQTHAEGFYKKLGYQAASEVFIEDGIPHVVMVKDLGFEP